MQPLSAAWEYAFETSIMESFNCAFSTSSTTQRARGHTARVEALNKRRVQKLEYTQRARARERMAQHQQKTDFLS